VRKRKLSLISDSCQDDEWSVAAAWSIARQPSRQAKTDRRERLSRQNSQLVAVLAAVSCRIRLTLAAPEQGL
jgi:hypothetical protein